VVWIWTRQAAAPVVIGTIVGVITRWPVGGVIAVIATRMLPGVLRRTSPGASSRKADAVASWTELIRDALAASAGLAQAIVVTAPSAPVPIRVQVNSLATRLSNGVPMTIALRLFADDVDDPAVEFLVCALLLAATSRAQRLVDVLGALSESIREEVSMRIRVETSRASGRSSVRTVIIFSVAFACALVLVAHEYLTPFGTATGQMVLAIVGTFYAAGLGIMARLVRPPVTMRLLARGQSR
jgi:Flp pilus assembly protein TadB